MVIVAIVALAVTIGFVLNNLMASPFDGGYGMEFSEILGPLCNGSGGGK